MIYHYNKILRVIYIIYNIHTKKMKNKKRKLSVFVEYLKSRQFFGVCMRDYVLRRNEGEV